MKLCRWCLITLSFVLLITSCQKDPEFGINNSKVTISFTNKIGTDSLQLNTPYSNTFGEPFTVTKFKYYISNLKLKQAGGAEISFPDNYYLIDVSDPSTLKFTVDVPEGNYNGISFLIGVDSTRNVSGAQTGALDPINDMFWTWTTGYIMLKVEGISPVSTLPGQMIEYHIGGFKVPNSVLRNKQFTFGDTPVSESGGISIQIISDLTKLFDAIHDLPIVDNPAVNSPGSLASQYADNYSNMFSLGWVMDE